MFNSKQDEEKQSRYKNQATCFFYLKSRGTWQENSLYCFLGWHVASRSCTNTAVWASGWANGIYNLKPKKKLGLI